MDSIINSDGRILSFSRRKNNSEGGNKERHSGTHTLNRRDHESKV